MMTVDDVGRQPNAIRRKGHNVATLSFWRMVPWLSLGNGFLPLSNLPTLKPSTQHFVGDRSSATLFHVGDVVTVIEDVNRAGKNLKGRVGSVIETWEKCDIDPTCCCAEWVDEGLSVHVKFDITRDILLANDVFIHYFAEDELALYK